MSKYDSALNDLIDNGYEFKFNQYIRDGFDLFSRYMGGFIGYYAIVIIIIGFSSMFLPGVGNILQPALLAGVLIVANEVIKGRNPDFSLFFKGFNYFLPLFLYGLISGIFIAVGLILLIVPGLYLAVAYQFTNMLIIFLGYDFWPAMEFSRKIITKNWWSFFGFAIVLGLINIAGVLALGIGVFFTAPATLCMTFCAFEDIVGRAVGRQSETTNNQGNNNYTYTSV